MRKINKIINIALIFMLIGVFVCQDLAYSSDISCLRVPVGIDKGRALEVISKLQSKEEEAEWNEIKFAGSIKHSGMSITQQVEYKKEECFAKWAPNKENEKYILSEAKNLRYLESKGVKNIPKVRHLLRTEDDTPVMLLEKFDEGETLDKKIGKLSQDEAIDIILKVSKIVKSLLDNGIYHWDISPNNIWIADKGEIILFDFGLSFMSGSEEVIKNNIYKGGNIFYVSPNRLAKRDKPEEYSYSQSDEIYSLGVILAKTLNCRSASVIDPNDSSYVIKNIMAELSERDDLKIILPILERALSGEYDTIEEFIKDLASQNKIPVDIKVIREFIDRHQEFKDAYYDEGNTIYPKGCETFCSVVGEVMEKEGIDVYAVQGPRHMYLLVLGVMEDGSKKEVVIDYTADQIFRKKISPLIDTRDNLKNQFPDIYDGASRVLKISDINADNTYVIYTFIIDIVSKWLERGIKMEQVARPSSPPDVLFADSNIAHWQAMTSL